MRIIRHTQPSTEPITIAQAKIHLKMDDDEALEDAYVTAKIKGAREWIEGQYGVAMITQRVTESFDKWASRMPLQRGPVQAIHEIQYLDDEESYQSYDNTNVRLEEISEPAYMITKKSATYPAVNTALGAVRVTYTCGYGDNPSDVPEYMIDALYLRLGASYDNRSSIDPKTLRAINALMRTAKSEYSR